MKIIKYSTDFRESGFFFSIYGFNWDSKILCAKSEIDKLSGENVISVYYTISEGRDQEFTASFQAVSNNDFVSSGFDGYINSVTSLDGTKTFHIFTKGTDIKYV